jgi:hypothetical protein
MTTLPDTAIELETRAADGIDVRLLWHPTDERVTVRALDTKSGEAFEVEVRDGERALEVFHHPYAYAAFHGVEPEPLEDEELAQAA